MSSSISAAHIVLLAAADLANDGAEEFSEWDLTVSAWHRDPNRFGCRGYEDKYPDHKRVMMEIMGKSKRDNPVQQAWLERVRRNTYRITPLGLAMAREIESNAPHGEETAPSAQLWYDAVVVLRDSVAFRQHIRNPSEPRMWAGAASFYGIRYPDANHLRSRLRSTTNAIKGARLWLDEHELPELNRGPVGGAKSITAGELAELAEFDAWLRDRFADQIHAISSR